MAETFAPSYTLLDISPVAGSTSIESPPSYNVEPTVQPFHRDKFTRLISLDTALSSLDYNSLITGTVVVCPQKPIEPGSIVLEIVGNEQAMVSNGQFWRSNKKSRRTYICSRHTIPYTCTLEPGYRYCFPFTLQFPIGYDHIECKDGLNHCTIPPTLGVGTEVEMSPYGALIDYHVRSFFSRSPAAYCRRNIVFTPRRCLLLDLGTFVDENNQSLDRTYDSGARIVSSTFRGKLAAVMTLFGQPFRHDGDSSSGQMNCSINISQVMETWSLENFAKDIEVSFLINKVVYSAPDGIGNKLCKTPKTSVQKYKVASGKADASFNWQGNFADLSLMYEVEKPILLRTPNFVSCHSAVTYEFEVILSKKNFVATLAVPLIVHYPQPIPYYDSRP